VAGEEAAFAVFDKLSGKFVELSQLKFSSNVVERYIDYCNIYICISLTNAINLQHPLFI
jgi:hypothetical protein